MAVLPRLWLLCVIFGDSILGSRYASAQTLLEADIVRIARLTAPAVRLAQTDVALAVARRLENTSYPNPSISWEREYVARHEGHDAVLATIPFDLGPSRFAKRALAQTDMKVAQAAGQLVQRDSVLRALSLFYDALATEQRLVVLRQQLVQLEETQRIYDKRVTEGVAPGMDRARWHIEASLHRSTVRETEAMLQQLRGDLTTLLGIDAGPSLILRGELMPTVNEEANGKTTVAQSSTGDATATLQLLQQATDSARVAHRRAAWAWVPSLALTGGFLRDLSTATRYGYKLAIALEIPLFSYGQSLSAQSRAKVDEAQQRLRQAQLEAQVQRNQAQAALTTLGQDYRELMGHTVSAAEQLLRAAHRGYAEGQTTGLELMEAMRSHVAVQLRRIELAVSIKKAQLRLRALRGEFQ